MSNPQRIHPVAIVFTFFRLLKDMLIPLAFGTIALFRNLEFGGIWLRILIAFLFLIAMLVFSFISWHRFTYKLEEGELRTVQGVFVRKKRYISKNRIQSIDLSAGPIHRIFGLVRVEVQTAGNNQSAEAGLKAVTRQEGERIRSELQSRTEETEESEERQWLDKEGSQGKQLSFPILLLAATTSGGIGVFLSVFTVAGSQLNQLIPDDFFPAAYQWVVQTSIALLVILGILVLVVLWLMAIAGTLLKYSYFTIGKDGDELRVSRGLLEKKQLTIPLKRIQAIRIHENLLRQPLGYAAVYAEVAGGSADKADDFSTVLFPMIKKEEIDSFLTDFTPEYHVEPAWESLPKRAGRRYILRAAVLPLLLAIPLLYFLPFYWWGAAIILMAAVYLGYLRYRDAGFAIDNEDVAFRSRLFSRETVLVKRRRIQAFSTTEHIFQRRADVKSIQLSVASQSGMGKSFHVKDVDKTDADELINWYSFRQEKEQDSESGQVER